jgi:hypothetical protein
MSTALTRARVAPTMAARSLWVKRSGIKHRGLVLLERLATLLGQAQELAGRSAIQIQSREGQDLDAGQPQPACQEAQ